MADTQAELAELWQIRRPNWRHKLQFPPLARRVARRVLIVWNSKATVHLLFVVIPERWYCRLFGNGTIGSLLPQCHWWQPEWHYCSWFGLLCQVVHFGWLCWAFQILSIFVVLIYFLFLRRKQRCKKEKIFKKKQHGKKEEDGKKKCFPRNQERDWKKSARSRKENAQKYGLHRGGSLCWI